MTKTEIEAWHDAHPFGERDEAYVDAVLAHVKRVWLKRRTCRLGQAMCNAMAETTFYGDVFNVPDEAWVDAC